MTKKLLTDDELRAIEERRAAAPKSPWSYGYEDDGPHCLIGDAGLLWGRITECPGRPALATAAFLTHASYDVPRLLADLHRYRDFCRRLVDYELDADDREMRKLAEEVRAAMEGDGEH